MTFTLSIEMDNAAFEDDPHGELRQILERVLERIDHEPLLGKRLCRDTNGNTVGEWRIA